MKKRFGEVYWANSQRIDKTDLKTRRQYVVTKDNGTFVGVSKIRGFNNNDKNNERLFELNINKYPLKKRCGVDNKIYSRRSDNKKPLCLEDKDVFDNNYVFKLSSHDTHNILNHVNLDVKKKKGRKK